MQQLQTVLTMNMKTLKRFTLPILCTLLWLPAVGAQAGKLYKWVDENGQVHYTNQLPPEASKQERRVINDQGRTLKVYRAPRTAEEKAEDDPPGQRRHRRGTERAEPGRQEAPYRVHPPAGEERGGQGEHQ